VARSEADLLPLLVEHELAIKRLYEAFADAFVERRAFWEGLAVEEQGHADRLDTLRSLPGATRPVLNAGGLRPEAIRSSLKYVEAQTAKALAGAFSGLQALAIARDLEHALIEEYFSRVREQPDPEARDVLSRLAADTSRHRNALAEALAAERRASSCTSAQS